MRNGIDLRSEVQRFSFRVFERRSGSEQEVGKARREGEPRRSEDGARAPSTKEAKDASEGGRGEEGLVAHGSGGERLRRGSRGP